MLLIKLLMLTATVNASFSDWPYLGPDFISGSNLNLFFLTDSSALHLHRTGQWNIEEMCFSQLLIIFFKGKMPYERWIHPCWWDAEWHTLDVQLKIHRHVACEWSVWVSAWADMINDDRSTLQVETLTARTVAHIYIHVIRSDKLLFL